MTLRHRPAEFFVSVMLDGKVNQKRNVASIDHPAEGRYIVKLPLDRFVRPETHRITVMVIGNERRTAQLADGAGGNQLEVNIYQGDSKKNGAFVFIAERL